jgi:hypothetical protein
MTYRRVAWALATALVAAIIPVAVHADPSVPPGQPVKCLTNTPKKQVLIPCDLLNAGANFPPGYRCPLPLEQYPQDVQDWCGVGPGLGVTPPGAPPPAPPTSSTSPTSPTKPTSPTSTSKPTTTTTTPISTATPTTTTTTAATPTTTSPTVTP